MLLEWAVRENETGRRKDRGMDRQKDAERQCRVQEMRVCEKDKDRGQEKRSENVGREREGEGKRERRWWRRVPVMGDLCGCPRIPGSILR